VVWPDTSDQIVLASNEGSGPLPSLQAVGQVYVQNDRRLAGFNPNEEHALMQGGQAFALRDDLNVTDTNASNYSSEPFVLLDYVESDGRPAMRPFRVLREDPSKGWEFDYAVEAGTVLQPPMPLPLLEKPFAPRLLGEPPSSLNEEIAFWPVAGSVATEMDQDVVDPVPAWDLAFARAHGFPDFFPVVLQSGENPPSVTHSLIPLGGDLTGLTGLVTARAPAAVQDSSAVSGNANWWRFQWTDPGGLSVGDIVVVVAPSAPAASRSCCSTSG